MEEEEEATASTYMHDVRETVSLRRKALRKNDANRVT